MIQFNHKVVGEKVKKLVCSICLSFLISACATVQSTDHKQIYSIQSTEKLEKDFNDFLSSYNEGGDSFEKYIAPKFVLETLRPNSDHLQVQNLFQVKKSGLRSTLFGEKVKIIEHVMVKPWIAFSFVTKINGVKVTDLAVLHFDSRGILQKAVVIWSPQHYQAAFKKKIKVDSLGLVKQGVGDIEQGYKTKDLKIAYRPIPEFVVFLKMNPFGERDLSFTGEYRKKFLRDLVQKGELWDPLVKKKILLPPYSVNHTVMSREGKVLTERIVFRKFEDGKLVFSINFIGDEEFRIDKEEGFFKENPTFRYQYLYE